MADALFIGLMSGTSLDGVDAVLVAFSPTQPLQALHSHFVSYPDALRAQIKALQHPTENELEDSALIANHLAKLYAESVEGLLNKANLTPEAITAIGCHGQTIRHRPELGFTLQIGNAALLAELTNITVISDFRSRDIAAGGQGAPLVPAFHRALYADSNINRAIINIGGIANITYLARTGETLGFDSGPGNMLLDTWIKQHLNLDYDCNGAWARSGVIIPALLSSMLDDSYFSRLPPKSTGRDLFNQQWLNVQLKNHDYAPNDVAHTLVALTAHSIHDAVNRHCGAVEEIYLCGGGAKNHLLTEHLRTLFGNVKLSTIDALGIGADWAEAIAFAWLASACMHQQPVSLENVTGAKGPRILGAIYQA